MQKRPFVLALVCYILGEVCGILCIGIVPMVLLSIVSVAIFSFFQHGREKIWSIFYGIIFLLGCVFWQRTVPDQIFQEKTSVTMKGIVSEIQKGANGDKLIVSHGVFFFHEKTIKCKDKIVVLQGTKPVCLGDGIQVQGTVEPLEHATNPGGFDGYSYYRGQQVSYTMQAQKIQVLFGQNTLWWTYKKGLRKIRERAAQCYDYLLCQPLNGICKAMVLGEKSDLDALKKKEFQDNGIAHILAISGLHIAFWGVGLFRILRKTIGYYLPCVLLASMLVVSYVLLIGLSGSALRAMIMLLVSFIGKVIGKQYDLLSSMSFAALLILLLQPIQLLQCGFLLSFGAIGGIAILYPAFVKKEKKKPTVFIRIRNGFYASLSIQMATLPILLLFYYQVPVYSIFLNLIVVPLMSVLLPFAVLGVVAGYWSFCVGQIFLYPVVWILNLYDVICGMAEQLPGAIWNPGYPKGWGVAIYYIVLAVLVIIKNKWGCSKVLYLGIAACLCFCPMKGEELDITVLDVGQGNGIYIELPTRENFFYDCGSSSKQNIYQDVIEPFLRYKGKKKVTAAFITHGDQDHCNGMEQLLEAGGSVGTIFLPDIMDKDNAYQRIENLAIQKGCLLEYVKKGQSLKRGDVKMQFLHPTEGIKYADRNEYSMTMYLTYGTVSFLFPGDLVGEGENQVAKELEQCLGDGERLTGLVVAHHGSMHSTKDDFLKVANPKYAIISVGAKNKYGHPHEELLERLNQTGSKVITTKDDGAVIIEIREKEGEIYGYKSINVVE